jgi:hypothetical protein
MLTEQRKKRATHLNSSIILCIVMIFRTGKYTYKVTIGKTSQTEQII